MSVKAVIFDLDGTLTEPFLDFATIRREMGLAPDGEPILEAMEKMGPLERQKAQKILDAHERLALEHSTLNPGAHQTLAALRDRGILIGVLTRNCRDNAAAVARKHGLSVDYIVGREDGPVKPDAFGVLRICERFGVRPCQALVVGDYLFDLLSANAAGAVSVLLTSHPQAGRFSQEAAFTIDNLGQLIGIVEKCSGPEPRVRVE
jgi:HAD superfamily hydrolase (TIGR01509 family)